MSKAENGKHKNKVENTFGEEIRNKDRVFVLFYASWCPFSKRFLPIFEKYARSNPQECLSVIIDDKPDICEEYSIQYYPTVLLFKKGIVSKRIDAKPLVGLSEKELKKLTNNP
jgi:thiol-disulfide isomerase/thioredoxin